MFCDICDSTAMSEELDAEDVREVVLVYQAFVGEVRVLLSARAADASLLMSLFARCWSRWAGTSRSTWATAS